MTSKYRLASILPGVRVSKRAEAVRDVPAPTRRTPDAARTSEFTSIRFV
jgi:hypothetical protein